MGNNIIIDNKQMINSMHNDIQCIESLDEKDKGTSRQYWFSASMLAEIFGISLRTVRRNIEFLQKWKEITMWQNCHIVEMQNSVGATKETQLYDLHVFNKLAMQLKTDAAMEIRAKFSDILVEVETTGSYGLQLTEHDLLLLNISKAKTDTERALAVSKLDEYHERKRKALEAENEDLKNTNDELLTENELIRGNYFNTKQIYEILKRDYPEALKQAESTNYNKLRKVLCDITNEKRQGRKVYKKHVKNDKGETEWRQEYYFEKNILDTILERVKDSIRYIFNIRLR